MAVSSVAMAVPSVAMAVCGPLDCHRHLGQKHFIVRLLVLFLRSVDSGGGWGWGAGRTTLDHQHPHHPTPHPPTPQQIEKENPQHLISNTFVL